MAVWRKIGAETLDFGLATPKRYFCAEPSRLTYLSQNRYTRLSCSLSREPKKVAESLCAEGREITHAQNRNP